MEETSEIAKYFADKSIFITGATGFLGKVLIEKLLRSCPEVKKIYVLVRHKKGNTPQQRIADILKCPLYDQVRKADPDFIDKLDPIEGDLLLPAMGISPEDEKKLIADVDIVFHSAATVRFDEPIKLAVKMNIIGTRKIIDLCKQMSHLESFVHVSTAYANCNRSIIDEEIYKPPINPNAITEFVESISDEIADQIAPMLIQPWPNTYTYTKAITETLVLEECVDRFPCAIVRPSIVGGSYREPFPGWIDNFNGPTAIFASVGKGLLRTMYGDKSCIADILPVDYSVNTMIVAAWATGTKKPKKIPVYNNTTGQLNRFTWGYMEQLLTENAYENPLESIFIPPRGRFTMNRVTKKVRHVLEELVPAHLLDYYLHFSGKKKLFVRLLSRITRGARTLEYFTTHQWHFISSNIEHVEKEMNDTDRKIFYLNVRDIEWGIYIRNYYIGMKKYLLKEDMSKMNRCKKALKKSIMVQNVSLSILFILFILFIWYIFASFLRLTF